MLVVAVIAVLMVILLHDLTVYVKEALSFAQDLFLKNSSDF